MKNLFTAIITLGMSQILLTTSAQALDVFNQFDETTPIAENTVSMAHIKNNAHIAVARLDGGRLIPTPYNETIDWKYLDRRIDVHVSQLGADKYIQYIPEIPFHGQNSHNKIDEIRLTAAGEGFDYVLIYGVGPDASWASFGKKNSVRNRVKCGQGLQILGSRKAKALLVDIYDGQVLGAVTANDIEF